MERNSPDQLGFVPFSIMDKEIFLKYWNRTPLPLSSYYHFTTMIAWLEETEIYYKPMDAYLCFLLRDRQEANFRCLPPLGPYGNVYRDRLKKAFFCLRESERKCNPESEPFRMEQVKEWMLPYFLEFGNFAAAYDRGDSDYLYWADDFAAAFEDPKIRYDIRHFIKYEAPVVREFAPENRRDCMQIIKNAWCAHHDCAECTCGCQKNVLNTLLESGGLLELQGFVVYTKGLPSGYVGVALAKQEMIFEIKKNLHEIRGLGSFLNKEAYLRYGRGCKWINYTEDMGQPGLRHYKEHLAPYTLSHNYILTERAV